LLHSLLKFQLFFVAFLRYLQQKQFSLHRA
jgi:hypothetical protein